MRRKIPAILLLLLLLPAVLAGLAGAAGGAALAHFLGNEVLTRVFAVFLAVIGGKELFRIGK